MDATKGYDFTPWTPTITRFEDETISWQNQQCPTVMKTMSTELHDRPGLSASRGTVLARMIVMKSQIVPTMKWQRGECIIESWTIEWWDKDRKDHRHRRMMRRFGLRRTTCLRNMRLNCAISHVVCPRHYRGKDPTWSTGLQSHLKAMKKESSSLIFDGDLASLCNVCVFE